MARPSVIPELREKLESYLEDRERDWLGQGKGERRPTLPLTSDGKVNVRQLAADAGLLPSQAQHLFNKPELAGPVNAVALAQGVKPIGSRALQDIEDEGVRKQVAKVGRDNSELRRTASEREALIDLLRRENGQLRAQLGMLEETGMSLRTGSAS